MLRNIVPNYYNDTISEEAWLIGEAFLKGILLEVSSYPKPGLVSSISMGSHRDMNILTFMVSSAAIAPAFYLCAQAGLNHNGEIKSLLPVLREIGKNHEKRLLTATKGINTQRGILFAVGMVCGAAGFLTRKQKVFSSNELFSCVSDLTKGLVIRELINIDSQKKKYTAGEQLYLKYKVTGIRGEVENGFPCVRKIGLPAFQDAMKNEIRLNLSLVHVLISLMSCVEDTTILWRKGKEKLLIVQNEAKKILEKGSVFTEAGLNEIYKLDKLLINNHISPGGSADLVSVTIGAYLLENKQFPVEIL